MDEVGAALGVRGESFSRRGCDKGMAGAFRGAVWSLISFPRFFAFCRLRYDQPVSVS